MRSSFYFSLRFVAPGKFVSLFPNSLKRSSCKWNDDILMGFYCDVDGDDTLHMDTGELRYEAWVPREEIILQPQDYSLTNEMMRMFKERKEPR